MERQRSLKQTEFLIFHEYRTINPVTGYKCTVVHRKVTTVSSSLLMMSYPPAVVTSDVFVMILMPEKFPDSQYLTPENFRICDFPFQTIIFFPILP